MARTIMLNWPSTQTNNGFVSHLTPEGQLRIAKERVDFVLKEIVPRDYPGEAVTIAFAFGGFVPNEPAHTHQRI